MRPTTQRLCFAVLLLAAAWTAARAGDPPQGPPVAPVRAVVDDYHGTRIADPYRYFEDFKDPEVQAWVRG